MCVCVFFLEKVGPLKFNSSPLKNFSWKTILSFWVLVTFQGRAVKLRGGFCNIVFLFEGTLGKCWFFVGANLFVEERHLYPGKKTFFPNRGDVEGSF